MRPKLPPLFRRKLEEIKRRRAGATLSRKQLLREEDLASSPLRHHLTSSSDGEVDEDSTATSKAALESEPLRPNGVVSDGKVMATVKDNGNAKDKVEEAVNGIKGTPSVDEEQENAEYGRFSDEESSLLFPSSPSFRIYYIESLKNKEDDDDGGKDYKTGYSSDSNVDSANTSESTQSTEESDATTKKRERKGMRFMRVFTMSRPVKCIILNVRSCGCTGGIHIPRSRLISTKSASS